MITERMHTALVKGAWLHRLGAVFAGLAFTVTLMIEGRKLVFFDDEWDFILFRRGWDLPTFFAPHNEHWSTIPIVIYKALFEALGIRSYAPYLVALGVVYAAVALLVFEIINRRAGPWSALASAIFILGLGRGGENILWAFQIGWMLSIGFGLIAIFVLERPGCSTSTALGAGSALLLALMSSGIGLVFCSVVLLELAWDRRRRRYLSAAGLPLLVYVAWFAEFGRHAIHVTPNIPTVFEYVVLGVGSALTGSAGVPLEFGGVAILLFFWVIVAGSRLRGRPDARVVAAACGLVGQYVLFGLGRATEFGVEQSRAPRYVTSAAVFLLLVLAGTLFRFERDAPTLLYRRLMAVVSVGLLVPALALNLIYLRSYLEIRIHTAERLRAELATVTAVLNDPSLRQNVVFDPVNLPGLSPHRLHDVIASLGSPVGVPDCDALEAYPREVVARTIRKVRPLPLRPLVQGDAPFCPGIDLTTGL
ncbi:MAG: hypothetical protein ACYDGR_02925 [Candidatus Dormibacteria bacterium]